MAIKKFFFCIIFLTFLPFILNSQNKRLDSLINLSKQSKGTILISLLNEISWEYKSSNPDSALFYGKKALYISRKINDQKAIAKSYNAIGNVFNAKSNADSALYYHKKSLELKIIIKDSLGIADSYTNLGIISDESGDYLDALQYYFSALKIYEEKSKSFDQIPAVLVNIGIVYKKQKKYDKVLEYYQRALKIYEKNNFEIGITIINGNIGAVLIKLGKNKDAIQYSVKARGMYSKLGYKRYIPYMNANIASAEYNLKNYSKSIALYLSAIKDFSDDKNSYELSSAKIGVSKSYLSINQINNAEIQLDTALKIAKKNKFKEFEVEALRYLSEVNFKSKNYKDAYLFQQKFNSKKDSLFEKTKVKDINELLVKYETSKKQKEIAQQKKELLANQLEIKNRTLYAILLASALLFLGMIFFGVYKKNQLKRKQLQKEIGLKDALSQIKTQNRLQEQRLSISRDLHDNIGSQLTFIISSIDNLKYVTKDASDVLKNKLSNISSFTSDTIFQLRDTIWAMNKNEITFSDLHTRILSFIEKAKSAVPNTHFEIIDNTDKSKILPSISGMHIFRVAQEAVNNAVKYAEASLISIEANTENNQLQISVKDNGVGFDITKVALGNGLKNMEKRMSEIGGKVLITSKINQGTEIKISCNL